jgi:hypothetical protein
VERSYSSYTRFFGIEFGALGPNDTLALYDSVPDPITKLPLLGPLFYSVRGGATTATNAKEQVRQCC